MAEVSFIGAEALIAKAMAVLQEAVTQGCEYLAGEQQAAAPVRTGTLRASIHVEEIVVGGDSVTGRTATGGESNAYAVFVHEGTGPHTIEPSSAQALAWPGGAHPVKVVHHPGTKANKFMEGPLLANREVLLEGLAAAARGEF